MYSNGAEVPRQREDGDDLPTHLATVRYQHCGEQHLGRYLAEFDFRYNTRDLDDFTRSAQAIKSAEGKRLTYRRTSQRPNV